LITSHKNNYIKDVPNSHINKFILYNPNIQKIAKKYVLKLL